MEEKFMTESDEKVLYSHGYKENLVIGDVNVGSVSFANYLNVPFVDNRDVTFWSCRLSVPASLFEAYVNSVNDTIPLGMIDTWREFTEISKRETGGSIPEFICCNKNVLIWNNNYLANYTNKVTALEQINSLWCLVQRFWIGQQHNSVFGSDNNAIALG